LGILHAGHSQTLLISHPEVGNYLTEPVKAMKEWGVSEYTLDPTNNATYSLISDIIDSVVDLFPSDYIHVGGDEADHRQWANNPAVLNMMKNLDLDIDHVQGYFELEVGAMVKARDKNLIGWDEIMRGNLPDNVTIMSWEGMQPGVNAANRGYKVVMCPMDYAYFDRKYSPYDSLGRLGVLPLKHSYEWDPKCHPGLTEEGEVNILGGQGNIWTGIRVGFFIVCLFVCLFVCCENSFLSLN
jgi:hexosaminidase